MLLAEGIASAANFFPTSLQRGGGERIDFAKNRKFGRAVYNIGEWILAGRRSNNEIIKNRRRKLRFGGFCLLARGASATSMLTF